MNQTEDKDFHKLTIEHFLDRLASPSSTPSGGAAAALIGAECCALGEMVLSLTIGKKAYAAFEEKAKGYLETFNMARSICLSLMTEDSKNFKKVMADLKKAKELPEDKRKKARSDAYKEAVKVPEELAETMNALLPAYNEIFFKANPNLLADAVISSRLAVNCLQACIATIRANLAVIDDDIYKKDLNDSIAEWEHSISAVEAVLTYQVHL